MLPQTYLIFGDLHGRVLPAFRLALAWQRDHGERVAGLLQVGDLGYFPDTARLDKATLRHARQDPLELGVQDVVEPTPLADTIFADPDIPEALWFVAGNHEDHETLDRLARASGPRSTDFPVDHYLRVRCLRDGMVTPLTGGLRLGGLWGIDDQSPRARRGTPPLGRIRPKSAKNLGASAFDVLLMHESPRDAVMADTGSDLIDHILKQVKPAFAFFGHYHGPSRLAAHVFAPTEVFRMQGLEFRGESGTAEEESVGVLRWHKGKGEFAYLDPRWLRSITRHNWKER